MSKKALVVIDIQNDITKNYKEVIDSINRAIDWAVKNDILVIYIRHENLTPGSKTLKPGTHGAELATDLKVASKHIFTKSKTSALTSEEFVAFISENGIGEFYIAGADATICVKSTVFNLRKADYQVTVLSDCITSWDKKQIPAMLQYYEKNGGKIISLKDL